MSAGSGGSEWQGGVEGCGDVACKWWLIVPALWGIGLFWGEHISLTSEVPELKQQLFC